MLPPLPGVIRRGKQALRRHYGRLKGQMMRVTEPNWGPIYTGGILMNVRRWSAPTGRNWTFRTLRLPTDAGWGTSAMRKVNVATDRPLRWGTTIHVPPQHSCRYTEQLAAVPYCQADALARWPTADIEGFPVHWFLLAGLRNNPVAYASVTAPPSAFPRRHSGHGVITGGAGLPISCGMTSA